MTYYYPFFIGALLLLVRMTILRRWTYLNSPVPFRVRPAFCVLLSSALLSAPFWLPLLISMIVYGNNAAQQEWHHMGSVGIAFKYHAFSFTGITFLVSIYFGLRRRMTRLNRGLLLLLGTVSFYYFIGTTLGAMGKPINLIKANEFLLVLAGSFIGLMVATVMRTSLLHRGRGKAIALIITALFPIFLHGFNRLIRHPMVKTARTTWGVSWGLDKDEMVHRQGSVFLSAHEALTAFYPVYNFIAHNQHYAHPASRHIQRFRFLHNLQVTQEPYLFNLALTHNRFDHVDFFMPRKKDGRFQILQGLSNYPDRYADQALNYNMAVISDTTLFRKEKGEHLYCVLDLGKDIKEYHGRTSEYDLVDLTRLRMLRDDLDSTGQIRMDKYMGPLWSNWCYLTPSDGSTNFDNRIELLNAFSISRNDSLHFLFAFYVADQFYQDHRIFLHVYPGYGEASFDNYDFASTPKVKDWEKGDIVVCERTIPNHDVYNKLHLGFFRGNTRLGDGVWLRYDSSAKLR